MKKLLIICLAGISGILTTACQEKKTDKITVNWATFNIRYDNPADSLNNWKYRKDTVAAFIKANQLDIVGMQEVLHNQLEDLKQRLPEYAEAHPNNGHTEQRQNLLYESLRQKLPYFFLPSMQLAAFLSVSPEHQC